jgi:hypothetical protein
VADVGRFRRGGKPFDFATGVPRPGRYPPDNLGLPGAIEAIRFAPVEIGYGFDAVGRQIFRQVGDHNRIRGIAAVDMRAIEDGTFVHAHPPYVRFPPGDPRRRAGSFSPLDLVFMYESGLVEMVAVTAERTYYLRRRREGFFLDPNQLTDLYEEFAEGATQSLERMAARGIIPDDEVAAEGRIADEVMERFRPFFDYRHEEVSSRAV